MSGNEFVVSGDHSNDSRPPVSALSSLLKIPTVREKPLHKRLRNRDYTIPVEDQRAFRLRKHQGWKRPQVRTGEWFDYCNDFDHALHAAIGRDRHADRDGRRAEMVALFDGRAKWTQIRDWRRGKCKVPFWAFETLFKRLLARHQQMQDAMNSLRKMGQELPEYRRIGDIDV